MKFSRLNKSDQKRKASRKKEAIADRIKHLEDAIARGREYQDTGKHADWAGFRPLFAPKLKNGKELPPHKDWVRNVFLPRRERALRQAEKALDRLSKMSCLS